MNTCILMGRLTKDPEIRYSQGENSTAIARYTLAVDRQRTRNNQNPGADFINCVAFGKSAEHAEKYFHKGMRILVSGRIQTGSYTNRDGQKVYTTEVIANSQEFADSKGAGTGNANASGSAPDYDGGFGDGGYGGDGGFMNIPDTPDADGLPFN